MFADAPAAMRAARREEIKVEPDPEHAERFQTRYHEVYRDLYEQLRPAHPRLHALGQ
jgi:sugar (pentulose or hexulose) kinase